MALMWLLGREGETVGAEGGVEVSGTKNDKFSTFGNLYIAFIFTVSPSKSKHEVYFS